MLAWLCGIACHAPVIGVDTVVSDKLQSTTVTTVHGWPLYLGHVSCMRECSIMAVLTMSASNSQVPGLWGDIELCDPAACTDAFRWIARRAYGRHLPLPD